MKKNICRGYFAFDRTQMVEVVTWQLQYVDKKPLKACLHLK